MVLSQSKDHAVVFSLSARALSDVNPQVRIQAMVNIGGMSYPAAISLVEGRLEDSDSAVRWQAAYMLAEHNHSSSLPALVRLMKDPVLSVRKQAISIFSKVPECIPGTNVPKMVNQADEAQQKKNAVPS